MASTAMQDVAEAQETDVSATLSTGLGADQVPPLLMIALPERSTSAQKEAVGHEADVGCPPAVSRGTDGSHVTVTCELTCAPCGASETYDGWAGAAAELIPPIVRAAAAPAATIAERRRCPTMTPRISCSSRSTTRRRSGSGCRTRRRG